MEIVVSDNNACQINIDVMVVPVFLDQEAVCDCVKEFFDYAKSENDFLGKYLDIIVLPSYNKIKPKNVLFVGLGKQDEFYPNKIRVVASKVAQKISAMKNVSSFAVKTDILFEDANLAAQYFIEGAMIGTYKFDKYKTNNETKSKLNEIIIVSKSDIKEAVNKGKVISEAVNATRDLINEPAEYITPQKLAQIATEINGIETKIYGTDEIRNMGMGAFFAVGQGSRHEHKFIHMKYTPKTSPKAKVALIGKGITFDSGGLDIKPAASMLEMKGDMAGAASILSVMKAFTQLQPDVEVHGIIAACENMPASRSYKPGDILTAMNGKTIEVDNTDAEGRLTLADALCFAEKLEPDAIIDIATLTGACCVALGKVASGLLGNDDELIVKLQYSAEEAGEYLWEMPMYEEYFEDLKSDIADFKNSGSRYGGTSAAALFLQKFVKSTPWAHIDIAGTSIINKPLRELPKGPSGVGVRTLINYVCKL